MLVSGIVMIRIVAIVCIVFIVTLAEAGIPSGGSGECNRQREERTDSGSEGVTHANERCNRIVSLSPSTTETLFLLGLGERVVGVTRFCTYPPEAKEKQAVGGYFDPNYEVIAVLEPDVVILLPEQERVREFLDELGIRHFTVNNKTVSDILGAIETIGSRCGAGREARGVIAGIEARMQRIRSMTEGLVKPRVLVAVERTVESGSLRDVYVAGTGTHYDELIRAAGGVNAYGGKALEYPLLGVEGIIHCNPDVIIDILPLLESGGEDVAGAVKEWETVSAVNAVRKGRVSVLTGGCAVVPGPRFIELLEEMARIIHPEIDWNDR